MSGVYDPLYEYMPAEKVNEFKAKVAQKYKWDPDNLTPEQEADLRIAIDLRVENEQKRIQRAEEALRLNPEGQRLLAEQQFGAPVDTSVEAAGADSAVPFPAVVRGAKSVASPLVGGLGGSRSIEGETADMLSMLPKGSEVKYAETFTTTGSEMTPYVLLPGSTAYIPWNKPGLSQVDVGEAIGGAMTLEGLAASLATRFPLKGLLERALVVGSGGAGGAALDTLFEEEQLPGAKRVISRALQAFGVNATFDALGSGTVSLLNFGLGRSGRSAIDDPIAASAQRAEEVTQEYGLFPLQVGQDRGFTGRVAQRLSQFSDEFTKKLVQQRVTLADSFFGTAPDRVQAFSDMPLEDQAIAVSGLDNASLTALYQKKLQEAEELQRRVLGEENPRSRSFAGRETREAVFQVDNKSRQSFRLVTNARLARLEDELEAAAGAGAFEIDLTDAQVWAREMLEELPVPQMTDKYRPGDVVDPSGPEGNVLTFISTIGDEKLHRALRVLAGIPEGKLKNNQVITPWEYRGTDPTTNKKIFRPMEPLATSGLDVIREMRGILSDYYGNELVRGTRGEGIAKQMYQKLGEALKNTSGAPGFVSAVRRYNGVASRSYTVMDNLYDMNLAQKKDPEFLINQMARGAIPYQTYSYLDSALRTAGPDGIEARNQFKSKVIDSFFQDPSKIDTFFANADKPTIARFLRPEEQTALKRYKALSDMERRDSFVKQAEEYASAKDRSLVLYNRTSDEDFGFLMKQLPEQSKNLMRSAIIEDVLRSSREKVAGVDESFDPGKMGDMLQRQIIDMGDRAKLLFTDEQIKALTDKKFIANFYSSTSKLQSSGAGIAAAQTTTQALGIGSGIADPSKMASDVVHGFGKVFLEKRLADLIVNGPLNKLFRPKLGTPLSDEYLRFMVAAQAASVNSVLNHHEPKIGEDELLERAQAARRKGQRIGRYQSSQAQ